MAAPALDLKPSGVVSVSAGSAIACALFAGTFGHGFAGFKQAIAENARNLYPLNLLHKRPVLPHGDLYRNAILACIDALALTRLHHGPEIFVLIACPPRWAFGRMALLLGAVAAGLDACHSQTVHSAMGRCVGFNPLNLSVRECSTPADLADLIIASSCVPPLTPQARRNGMAILDGSLVSNVPIEAVPKKMDKHLCCCPVSLPVCLPLTGTPVCSHRSRSRSVFGTTPMVPRCRPRLTLGGAMVRVFAQPFSADR